MWCMSLYIWLQMNSGNSRVLSLIVSTVIICLSLSNTFKKTRGNYFLFVVQFIFHVLSKVEKTHVNFVPKSNLTSTCVASEAIRNGNCPKLGRVFTGCWDPCHQQKQLEVIYVTNEGKIYFNLPIFCKEAMHNFDFTANGMNHWPGDAALFRVSC